MISDHNASSEACMNPSPLPHVVNQISHALQRKSPLCLPFLGIARPQPGFQHSCVCERFRKSQDRSTYFLQQNRETDCGNIHINCSQTHDCGNWDRDPDIPFLGIFVSKFQYFVFAVCGIVPLTSACSTCQREKV